MTAAACAIRTGDRQPARAPGTLDALSRNLRSLAATGGITRLDRPDTP